MKKIFTLALIVLISSAARSQFSIGMHIGASTKNVIAGLHTQYQFNNRFTVGVNMTTHTDNSNPAFFQSRFGYTFGINEGLSVQPYAGYSYHIQSIDKNSLGGNFTAGVQVRYQLTKIALIYADVNSPVSKTLMFSVGIAGRLPFGCK